MQNISLMSLYLIFRDKAIILLYMFKVIMCTHILWTCFILKSTTVIKISLGPCNQKMTRKCYTFLTDKVYKKIYAVQRTAYFKRIKGHFQVVGTCSADYAIYGWSWSHNLWKFIWCYFLFCNYGVSIFKRKLFFNYLKRVVSVTNKKYS